VQHDHFAVPNEDALHQVDPLQAEPFFPAAVDRIIIRNGNVALRLHDGFVFGDPETNATGTATTAAAAASETAAKQSDENAPMAGFIEFRGRKINVSVDQFPLDATYAMRLVVLVDQLEILDRVSCVYCLLFSLLLNWIFGSSCKCRQSISFSPTTGPKLVPAKKTFRYCDSIG
jgi:hypothetical protein